MNEVKIFENPEFGSIRTVEINGEPWLVGKDVASALGYKEPTKAAREKVDQEDRGVSKIDTPFGTQEMTIINESGLYSLILSSKLPGAKKFKRWVTSEVLPSIRKHGGYLTPETIDRILDDPDTIIRLAMELKEERKKRRELEAENETQRQVIADFKPIKRYVDEILASTGTMVITQIAADYGMSAKKLNNILRDDGIQHKVNDQWILYRKYMGKGYTKSDTIPIVHSDGTPDARMFTKWTQKGRLLIHEILTKRGIKAVMDREAA